jgi:hypothetical protein
MNMPGFTAEVSLNELRGHYAMTPKDSFARSGLVIGQQLPLPLHTRFLKLDCPTCISPFLPTVKCDVIMVDYSVVPARREFLGRVELPQNCWDTCLW